MPDTIGAVRTIRNFYIFDQMATLSGSPYCQSVNPEIGQTDFFDNGHEEKPTLLTTQVERLATQS